MDRAFRAREPLEPDLFHRENEDRREPRCQPVEQDIEHCPRRAAAGCVAIAIERVLADIEVERRKINGREIEDGRENPLEIIGFIALAHGLIEFGQTVQHPALKLGHFRHINPIGLGEIGKAPQHIAHGVAQAAIAVGHALEDFVADPLVDRIVGLGHPKAQDVGAVLFDDLVGRNDIAERLGHLHALLVEREAAGHNPAIGRTADGAAALKHRGMEPAAVLVGAFEVDIGEAIFRAILAVAQNESVGRAGIEPNIQNIKDLIVAFRINDAAEEPLFRALDIPAIGALCLEGRGDAGIHIGVPQKEIGVGRQGALLGETGQRHTPCALAREDPIGPRFDHVVETVAARHGRPVHQLVDRGERPLADRLAISILPVTNLAVDGGKPLRCVAEDDRSF